MQDLPSAETLAETKFDLIIIGGGITGAGIFRQAGLQGLKALLLDAQDFAKGLGSRRCSRAVASAKARAPPC